MSDSIAPVFNIFDKKVKVLKFEDQDLIVQRKENTPAYILIFAKEAQNLHRLGYDVFSLIKDQKSENFLLKISPCPTKIQTDGLTYFRKIGEIQVDIATGDDGKADLYKDYIIGDLGSDEKIAIAKALEMIRCFKEPAYLFDSYQEYSDINYKNPELENFTK